MYPLDNVDYNILNNQHLILDFHLILNKKSLSCSHFFYITEDSTKVRDACCYYGVVGFSKNSFVKYDIK